AVKNVPENTLSQFSFRQIDEKALLQARSAPAGNIAKVPSEQAFQRRVPLWTLMFRGEQTYEVAYNSVGSGVAGYGRRLSFRTCSSGTLWSVAWWRMAWRRMARRWLGRCWHRLCRGSGCRKRFGCPVL